MNVERQPVTLGEAIALADAAVSAALRNAGRRTRTTQIKGATIVSYDPGGLATIRVDGDAPGVTGQARNNGGRLAAFDRVNVEFIPGGAAIIRGRRTNDVGVKVNADVADAAAFAPYGANWQAALAGYEPWFRRDSAGNVHLGGIAQWTGGVGLAPGTTMFTLPAGFQPVRNRGPWVVSSGGGGTSQVQVNADGTVVYIGGAAPNLGVVLEIIYDPGLGG